MNVYAMEAQRTLRVLFVSHSPHWGGAERCIDLLANGLDRRRCEVVVLSPGRGRLTRHLRRSGVRVSQADLRWWVATRHRDWPVYQRFRANLAARVSALSDYIREQHFDVVVTNTVVAVDTALAAAAAGVSHVWYVHELLSRHPSHVTFMSFDRLYALIAALSTRVVAASTAVRQEIEQFTGHIDTLRVVPTGIPAAVVTSPIRPRERVLGFSPRGAVVTFVGALAKTKGVLNLIQGAAEVIKALPASHFVIVGPDGDEAQEARRQVRSLRLDGAVSFLGFRNDVADIMASSDLLVVPSKTEAVSLVVLEAMSLGLPVVATRSGGPTEIVVDGETGFLVEPDSPDLLACSILRILRDPVCRRAMGIQGKKRFESHYTLGRYLEQFENVLLEAASSGPGGLSLDQIADIQDELYRAARIAGETAFRLSSTAVRCREFVLSVPGVRRLVWFP